MYVFKETEPFPDPCVRYKHKHVAYQTVRRIRWIVFVVFMVVVGPCKSVLGDFVSSYIASFKKISSRLDNCGVLRRSRLFNFFFETVYFRYKITDLAVLPCMAESNLCLCLCLFVGGKYSEKNPSANFTKMPILCAFSKHNRNLHRTARQIFHTSVELSPCPFCLYWASKKAWKWIADSSSSFLLFAIKKISTHDTGCVTPFVVDIEDVLRYN